MNYFNETSKLLKSCLKEQVKITTATIVGFLIMGTIGFAATNSNIDNSLTINEKEVGNMEIDEYGNYKWTNDKNLIGQVNVGKNLVSKEQHIEIINNGSIKNSINKIESNLNLGNGISASAYFLGNENSDAAEINTISNNGLILGEIKEGTDLIVGEKNYSVNMANGIGASSYSEINAETATIDNLMNKGTIIGKNLEKILGKTVVSVGNGISVSSFSHGNDSVEASDINMTKIENEGNILGYNNTIDDISTYTANIGNGIGIVSYGGTENTSNESIAKSGSITISDIIKNNGNIIGNINEIGAIFKAINIGNGIGISSYSQRVFDIEGSSKINKIENNGTIIGNTYMTITQSESEESGKIISENSNIGNGIGISSFGYEGSSKNLEVSSIINNGLSIGNNLGKESSYMDHSFNVGNGIGISSNSIVDISGDQTGNIVIHSGDIKISQIKNLGIIAGNSIDNFENSINIGNGIGISSTVSIEDGGYNEYEKAISGNINIEKIENSGIISGYTSGKKGSKNSGNGIGIYSSAKATNETTQSGEIKLINFTNTGVILGKENGISLVSENNKGTIENYNNYGIIAGKNPVNANITTNNNYGLEISLNDNEEVQSIKSNNTDGKIVNIDGKDYTIINGKITENSTESITEKILSKNSNLILNGVNNTLKIENSLKLTDSIINAYKTAILIDTNGIFNGENIIVNGGGFRTEKEGEKNIVISGTEGNNNLTLSGNSIINGDIDLAGTEDNDTLNFGNNKTEKLSENENINIFTTISNVENINIGQKVTFFEKAKIENGKSITINENGEMDIRLGNEKDTKGIKEHALYNTGATIKSEGNGKINFVLNGNGSGTIISLGNDSKTEIDKNTEIDTSSALHYIVNNGDGTLEVKVEENLKNPEKYPHLNKIHQSIVISKQDGEFTNVTDKKYAIYLKYLNDIYAGSPYAFSSELSRKSMDMFKSSILSKDLKPELNKWAIYGGLTHIDGGTKDEYYGKGYYTYDVGSRDINADTKITGAYIQAEYGKSESLTTGIVFGGNNSETEIGASKVEGDSFYFGAYAKKYLNDFRFTLGAGFQHGDYKADRTALGYEGITTTRDFSENYHDRGFNIYGDVKYSKEITENLFIEPYFTLGYSYVDQDGVSEDGTLSIETDSKNFDYATGKFGLDVKKVIPMEKGKHILTAGVSYENILSGEDEEYITGRFKGGSDFDVLVPEKNSDIFSLNAKYEFEFENGFMFDVKGTYTFENDNMEDEWIAGVGVGYRF